MSVKGFNTDKGVVKYDYHSLDNIPESFADKEARMDILGLSQKVDKEKEERQAEVAVERGRIDALTILPGGSTAGDAELMDARTDYEGKTWSNVGNHVRGITGRLIEACCDKKIISGGNYNLLKLSEISFFSRLQDGVSGIITSNNTNFVTGWIPVKYGNYYCPSILLDGDRTVGWKTTSNSLITRMNLQLDDGSVIVYDTGNFDWIATYNGVTNQRVIKILHENAVAMKVQFYFGGTDVSSVEKLEVFEPMIIEGISVADSGNKSLTYDYLNGEETVPAEVEYTLKRDNTKQDKVVVSPYLRTVDFGVIPTTYYRGVSTSYENSVFGRSTKYADFIQMWKSLVANHSSYVTETALGTASDGQTIYLYDFKPVRISNKKKDIPKVIIVAGQHGGETCNIFGLYYFISNLLNKWNVSPVLEYLRNHVELMIIPVLNTYGFDNQSYKNKNGVNLNRNYDSNWVFVSDTTSSQYGGAEPFDQTETQIIRDLLLANQDAVIVIDSHVNGGGRVSEYSDINYYGVCESTDSYYNRLIDAVSHNLSKISANFNLDYELGQPNTILGFLNNDDGEGLLRNWGRDKNFVSVLVEGFGGFPNRTSFAPEVFKANEEILVNWLITVLNYLAK